MNGVWRVQGVLATSRALGDYPLKVWSKDEEEIENGVCGYEQGDFLSYSDGCGDLKMMMMVVLVMVMVVVMVLVMVMLMVMVLVIVMVRMVMAMMMVTVMALVMVVVMTCFP